MDKTPNEKRSEAKNSNSKAHQNMLDNRSAQIKESIEGAKGNQQMGNSGNGSASRSSVKVSER